MEFSTELTVRASSLRTMRSAILILDEEEFADQLELFRDRGDVMTKNEFKALEHTIQKLPASEQTWFRDTLLDHFH